MGLCAAVLLAAPGVDARIDRNPPCGAPGLEGYLSKEYATENGVRRRCDLLRRMADGMEPLPGSVLDTIRSELARRFAVTIDFTGSVELPGRVVDYLLENMPETAALVTAYTGKEYRATQVDATPGPAGFFVTDNKSFAADFTYLRSRVSNQVSQHMLLESGYAKVIFWRVWGSSFISYELDKSDASNPRYDIRVEVFTNSRLLRAVLKSGLFRYFAGNMFDDILNDIQSGVRAFAEDPDAERTLPPYFVSGLRDRLPG